VSKIDEILTSLRDRDVRLWLEDDRLRYSARKDALSSELREEMARHKAEIVAFLRQASSSSSEFSQPIRPAGPAAARPLSFGQERLWFLCQLEGEHSTYNMPAAFSIHGPLDASALTKSLQEIVRRHEVLRAGFGSAGGRPEQFVGGAALLTVPVVDLQSLPEAEQSAEVGRRTEEHAQRTLDLATPPLIRASLLKLAPDSHVLLLAVHHIAFDGWSIGLLTQELSLLYSAFVRGEPSRLPELPIQYADYARWQRDRLRAEHLASQLDFWKRYLVGAPQNLDLPLDRPRSSVQTFRGRMEYFSLSRTLTTALREVSLQNRVTLFMTLLAGLQTLLHRYTAQDDMIVGSPVANRQRPETEGLMGLFVNILVLRNDLSGDPTFAELLERVRESTLSAYAHQELPFEKLVEELRPARDLSRNPLYQVMFALENTAWRDLELAGLKVNASPLHNGGAKVDLTLYLSSTGDGLNGAIEYNTDLFDSGTIRRMTEHSRILLTAASAYPSLRISQLPLLTTEEEHELLVERNQTASEYSRTSCIPDLFEARAAETPEAVAFSCAGEDLTYGHLNAHANRQARYLRERGVLPGHHVGLCMSRSLDTAIALVAILKTGAAYVPLDPAYPPERLSFLIQDSAIESLLSDSTVAVPPSPSLTVVPVRQTLESLAEAPGDNLGLDVSPESAAYVIYTSGSTGQPKGVIGPHRGALNRFAWMWKTYPFAGNEVCCAKTSLSFVDSVWEIWGGLLQGVRTVLVEDQVVQDPQRFVALLAREQVTRLVLVPSLLRMLLESCQDLAKRLPRLHYWVSSGEPLPLDLLQRFQQIFPDRILLNLYGSTEVAADVTCYDTRTANDSPGVPIGRPIANTQVYILDSQMQPVPVGVSGELYVGGEGLATGYWNRPELTAEKFVANRFSSVPGARLYRTGDRARYLADGNIEYLGRVDRQVKVRGVRIELEEIEAVLAQHPHVRQTAVTALDDGSGDLRLVAYVTSKAGPALTSTELRNFLQQKLPAHMIPASYVLLDTLPLTPNGKLDRLNLPARDSDNVAQTGTHFQPPRDALERKLAEIWEGALGLSQVGITDNFFELGGHSLLGVTLLDRIQKAFGRRLPAGTLFASPSIEQLAKVLRQDGWTPPWLIPLQPRGSHPPIFCVDQRMNYRNLALELGNDQPVYLLPFDNIFPEGNTREVTDIAREFIRQMRIVQPEGPYYLVGMCLGGRVALAIAHHLCQQGEKVAMLAIIDTLGPGLPTALRALPLRKRLRYFLFDELILEWKILKRLNWKQRANIIKTTIKLDARFRKNNLKWRLTNAFYHMRGRSVPRKYHDVFRLMRASMRDYCPPYPFPGCVTLFRPIDRPSGPFRELEGGWNKGAVSSLVVHEIPGRHGELLMKPNVTFLGQKLAASLREARKNAKSGNPAPRDFEPAEEPAFTEAAMK
jgi:amino acid adenylation domain-containing protein